MDTDMVRKFRSFSIPCALRNLTPSFVTRRSLDSVVSDRHPTAAYVVFFRPRTCKINANKRVTLLCEETYYARSTYTTAVNEH